jgi:flavin-dependent dehydrogenase
LADLGVWERFASQGQSPSYGHGWHIDRSRLDAILALAATEGGAKVCRGTQVDILGQDPSGEWQIAIKSRTEPRRYRTRFLLDASGRPASLARKQGARRIVFDRLFGIVAFLSSNALKQSSDSRTLIEAVEHGWWYSARLPNSQLVIAYMADADLCPKRSADRAAHFQEQLQKAPHTSARAKDHSIKTGPRIFAANSCRLDRPAGRNWLAIGDATMAFDPLSSQGICQAMRSGLEAAGLIHAHWKSGVIALDRYAQSVNQTFETYLNERDQYYGREKRWPLSIFWHRRNPHAKP